MFRTVLLVASMLITAGPAVAQDDRIPMAYTEYNVTDRAGEQYWEDIVPQLFPDTPRVPKIYVYEVPTEGGGKLTITTLNAPAWCGLHDCPVRILQDGVLLGEFPACSVRDLHFLSADGQFFYGCDLEVSLTELAKQTEAGKTP